MLEPRLKISRRCLNDVRRSKARRLHSSHGLTGQVIDQAQVMLPLWPHIDVPAIRVLKSHPWNRADQRIPVPRPRDHHGVSPIPSQGIVQTDLKTWGAHRCKLLFYGLCRPVHPATPDTEAQPPLLRTAQPKANVTIPTSRLHREVEEGSYRTVRAETVKALASPVAQNDPPLRIRGLALLGNIDLNTNTAAAIEDWNEVLAIAKRIEDRKWENRAKGELGLVAGVQGNIGAAGLALYAAIAKAEQLGDVAAHIYFATWLANGMAVHGMADRAVSVIDKATALTRKSGYTEVPLQLSVAKIRALTNLPEPQSEDNRETAGKLIAATLAEAEKQHVLGAQTELLNEAGQVAAKRGDLPSAEKAFHRAVEVSQSAALPREEAEACLHLSQFYRVTNQPAKASVSIDQSIQALHRAEEAYDLPVFVAEKAEVQAALGSLHAADASFQRATDLVEGLLVNAPSSQVKSGMIGALSQIYLGHFRLAWNRLHNAPYAFSIIESARGRALLDSIRYGRQSGPAPTSQTRAEGEIARLQRSLLHDRMTNVQTRRVIDQLDQE